MKTFFKWVLIIAGVLVLLAIVGYVVLNESKPTGTEGPKAEALTDKMLLAVDKAAWDTTKVISWDFAGRQQYIWNKAADSVQVRWDDVVVELHTKSVTGSATKAGVKVSAAEANKLIQAAWSNFCNDSFWLSAPFKVRDPGTSRSLVNLPNGQEALLITYGSGGVTPGDSYLWILDDSGLPTAWKMWVNIIPIGGVEATWENYKTLSTGARISQTHVLPVFTLELTEIAER